MIKTEVAFLDGRLFSSQSGLFEYFSDCSEWLVKSRPSKKATLTGYLSSMKAIPLLFPWMQIIIAECCIY